MELTGEPHPEQKRAVSESGASQWGQRGIIRAKEWADCSRKKVKELKGFSVEEGTRKEE
jgi:hypothetical protein